MPTKIGEREPNQTEFRVWELHPSQHGRRASRVIIVRRLRIRAIGPRLVQRRSVRPRAGRRRRHIHGQRLVRPFPVVVLREGTKGGLLLEDLAGSRLGGFGLQGRVYSFVARPIRSIVILRSGQPA